MTKQVVCHCLLKERLWVVSDPEPNSIPASLGSASVLEDSSPRSLCPLPAFNATAGSSVAYICCQAKKEIRVVDMSRIRISCVWSEFVSFPDKQLTFAFMLTPTTSTSLPALTKSFSSLTITIVVVQFVDLTLSLTTLTSYICQYRLLI